MLQGGTYQYGAIADYSYSFQVQGAPNTLVPLHMIGRVTVAPIHMTDPHGQVIDLVDGFMDDAPTDRFKIVSNAYLNIIPARLTPYPVSSAAISVTSSYGAYSSGGALCQNCDGATVVLDQTIWVWSNSNINVQLDSNVLLEYYAFGGGLDPINTFGNTAAEVDPIFSIDDPAYAGFSIVGVPTGNLPTTGGVPEPSSWALLICGFGMLGAAMRRNRRGSRRGGSPAFAA